MYKNMIKGMIIGGSLLGLVASAQAANQTYEYNIYGASAQHKFWNKLAPQFMTNSLGCATVVQSAHEKKNGITRGTGCI